MKHINKTNSSALADMGLSGNFPTGADISGTEGGPVTPDYIGPNRTPDGVSNTNEGAGVGQGGESVNIKPHIQQKSDVKHRGWSHVERQNN